jgi:hypothetical protein
MHGFPTPGIGETNQAMDPQEDRRKPDDQKSKYERMQEERGHEKDASMAPQQNRTPAEQHEGGPLPNHKK